MYIYLWYKIMYFFFFVGNINGTDFWIFTDIHYLYLTWMWVKLVGGGENFSQKYLIKNVLFFWRKKVYLFWSVLTAYDHSYLFFQKNQKCFNKILLPPPRTNLTHIRVNDKMNISEIIIMDITSAVAAINILYWI